MLEDQVIGSLVCGLMRKGLKVTCTSKDGVITMHSEKQVRVWSAKKDYRVEFLNSCHQFTNAQLAEMIQCPDIISDHIWEVTIAIKKLMDSLGEHVTIDG